MIDKKRFTPEWIRNVSVRNGKADKILVEKTIRAFLLVEGLVKHNINFVFKGGTSLILLFQSPKRLSIDVDIVLPEIPDSFMKTLNEIAIEELFIKVEPQIRNTEEGIPKFHYKFFYTPVHKSFSEEEYILLDLLEEEVTYRNIAKKPIESVFLPAEGDPVRVSVPSVEDILADKLTAFAPNTTGIPYVKNGINMGMEIIKQLYDIGNLFAVAKDTDVIKSTFFKFVKTEIKYRNLPEIIPSDILKDIYETSLCIVLRGKAGKGNFEELQTGINRISNFIFSENYHLEKAITHASRIAYLSKIIDQNANTIEKFDQQIEMGDWEIGGILNTKLNRLKKSNPEAFFYWYKIYLSLM